MKFIASLAVLVLPALCFAESDFDDSADNGKPLREIEDAWLSTRTTQETNRKTSAAPHQRNLQVLQQICNTVIQTVTVFDSISCDCEISATSGIIGLLCNTTSPVCAPGGNLCGTPSWFGSFSLLGSALYTQVCYNELAVFGRDYDPFCLDYQLNVFQLFSQLFDSASADSASKNSGFDNTKQDSQSNANTNDNKFNGKDVSASPSAQSSFSPSPSAQITVKNGNNGKNTKNANNGSNGQTSKGKRRAAETVAPSNDQYDDGYYYDDTTSTQPPSSHPPSVSPTGKVVSDSQQSGFRGGTGNKNQKSKNGNANAAKKWNQPKGANIGQNNLFVAKKNGKQQPAGKLVTDTRNFGSKNSSGDNVQMDTNHTNTTSSSNPPDVAETDNGISSNQAGLSCNVEIGAVRCNTCIICEGMQGVTFDCTNIVPKLASMDKCVRFDMLTNWKNMTQGRLTGAFPEIESLW